MTERDNGYIPDDYKEERVIETYVSKTIIFSDGINMIVVGWCMLSDSMAFQALTTDAGLIAAMRTSQCRPLSLM